MPNLITPWQISVLKALQHFSINKSLQGSYADVSTMGRYCPALRRPLVAFRLTEALGRERSVALSHKTSRGRYSPERTVAFGFVVTVEWECHSNDDWCWTCCTNTINSSAMQKVHKWTCSAQFLNLVCLFFFFLVPFFFFFLSSAFLGINWQRYHFPPMWINTDVKLVNVKLWKSKQNSA